MTNTASLLRRVRSRIAATTAIEDLQFGAAFGGAAALAVLVAGRLRWIDGDMAWPAATAVGVAVLFPLAGLLVRRTDARVIAARADEKLGLRERLSTSLWLGGTPTAEPLGGLVVADADAAAAAVASADIARAFRPRLLRRPLVAAGVAALGCAGLLLWQPVAQAVESPQQKAARLAEQNRAAEVAKKLEEAAKKVEEAATERKEETLAKVALEIKRAAQEMQRDPPQREAALTKLNKLADKTQAEARRKAGMKEALSAPETSAQDKQLEQLLQDMANAGLESLAKDLAELQQKLKDNPSGDGAPSAEDMRALANRMDALRRAIQRAEESGARDLAQSLRKLANDDVLAKIGQRLRSLAARLDARGYQGLASEGDSEGMDLSEMSREELEQLLKDLDELAGMEDLEKLLREGGAEARGGKKLRFRPGGAGGTWSGSGSCGLHGEDGEFGLGRGKSGSGQGKGEGSGQGMGGPGQGAGGTPEFGTVDESAKAEVARSKLDPKGRISVTTFRGLPKPGSLTAEDRAVLRAAREEAQAPLESDQIPRRYRDGIRSWFDGLGETK